MRLCHKRGDRPLVADSQHGALEAQRRQEGLSGGGVPIRWVWKNGLGGRRAGSSQKGRHVCSMGEEVCVLGDQEAAG